MQEKPPISKIVKTIVSKLKYFSIKYCIFSPNILIRIATIKNLVALPIREAIVNVKIEILHSPATIVKILKGIGVKAAVNIAKNAFSLYFVLTTSTAG